LTSQKGEPFFNQQKTSIRADFEKKTFYSEKIIFGASIFFLPCQKPIARSKRVGEILEILIEYILIAK